MNNDVLELQSYFCPLGFLDVQAACKIGQALWLSIRELFEIIDNDRESLGYASYEQIDPVACVLEHVLQESRQMIEGLTDYDFINDYHGVGNEIHTHWNYMGSAYDRSAGALEELAEKVALHLETLLENNCCHYFLTELWIKGR